MMSIVRCILAFVSCLLSVNAFAQSEFRLSVVAEGLYHPVGMALLPDGAVLIAEAGGHGARSAGISLLLPDGNLGRLVSGLLSRPVDRNLISAPAIAVSPDGDTILIGIAGAGLYSLPSEVANRLPDVPYTPSDLSPRHTHRGKVFLLHPFDITFDGGGNAVVSDAAGNGLLREEDDGSLSYFHRFDALDNPIESGGRLEPLPTGIARHNDSTYVALFGGCPHVTGSGELVAIHGDGQQRNVVDGLNMPVDVAFDESGNLWILEFAALPARSDCFARFDTREASGRLSRINADGVLESIAEDLHFPAAVLPLPDGGLYISEAFSGRVLRLDRNVEPGPPHRYPSLDAQRATYATFADLDLALREVIEGLELSPYPGRELREPDSELTRLGRDLFFDPILSGDKDIACSTCHHPSFAMTDARVLPIGTGGHGLGETRTFRLLTNVSGDMGELPESTINPFVGTFVPRNSPTIINAALLNGQFWDSRIELADASESVTTPEDAINDLRMTDTLATQALFPIVSEVEMAGVTFGNYSPMVIRAALINRLQGNEDYAGRFAAVFGESTITLRQVGEAIAAFERQLIFTESPWDDYIAGDVGALSDSQKRGALVFYGALNDGVNCATCHRGELFTEEGFHNLLVPQLGPGKDNGTSGRDDFGRANVTFDYRDQYRFKTPSLRNVELTAPYFHSGAYQTLEAVVWHHADPWRANMVYEPSDHLPPDFQNQVQPYDFEKQAHSVDLQMRSRMPISEADLTDLVNFLLALTDPAARDLSHLLTVEVPSGLPVDIGS